MLNVYFYFPTEKLFFYSKWSLKHYYYPRVNSLYGSKSLSYLGCKVWEEIPKSLKEQNYLIAFQSGLKNVLLRNQSDKSQS